MAKQGAGSVRVLRGSAEVGAARRCGPCEPAPFPGVFEAPSGCLLVAVVVAADGPGVAQAGPAALLVRGGGLVVAGLVGAAAGREGAAVVQDPGQVPERDPGIVALGLVPVVARSGEVLQVEHEVPGGAGSGGAGEGGDAEPDGAREGLVVGAP